MDDNLDKKSPPAKKPHEESVSYTRTSNQGPIGSIADRMKGVFSNRTTAILAVIVLVVGLGAATIAVQRSTEYRQQAATSGTPLPGTCLVLPQEFCATGKTVTNPDGTFKGIGFDLPDNTPVFAYDTGVIVSSFTNVATSTYQGLSLDPSSQTVGNVITVNTYFKDSAGDSSVSRNVAKGEILGYTHKDPQNPYDLLVNFAKQGNNTINIDQGLTTGNFSK